MREPWDALRAADRGSRTYTARRPTSGYGGVPREPALQAAPGVAGDSPVALPPCGSGMHLTAKRLKHSGRRKELHSPAKDPTLLLADSDSWLGTPGEPETWTD